MAGMKSDGVTWAREKRPGIGGAVWFHCEEPPVYDSDPFMIVANGEGIRFDGRSHTISNQEELQAFAQQVSMAWKDHLSLKPKIKVGGSPYDI